jgi:hypothetical protein
MGKSKTLVAGKPSRDDLFDALEHVRYELLMLLGSVGLRRGGDQQWSMQNPVLPPLVLAHGVLNLPVEGAALHARNLVEFLIPPDERPNGPGGRKPRPDDILARHYVRGFTVPEAFKPTLESLREKANKQVAHLTFRRVTDAQAAAGTGDKDWALKRLVPLLQVLDSFVRTLSETGWYDRDSAGGREQWDLAGESIRTLVAADASSGRQNTDDT